MVRGFLGQPVAGQPDDGLLCGRFPRRVGHQSGVGYVNEQTIPRKLIGEALSAVIQDPTRYRAAFNYGHPAGSANCIESIQQFLVKEGVGGLSKEIARRRKDQRFSIFWLERPATEILTVTAKTENRESSIFPALTVFMPEGNWRKRENVNCGSPMVLRSLNGSSRESDS